MAEFLLEILSEEIPARMQRRAGEDLCRLISDALSEADLTCTDMKSQTGPRRLTLVVDGLPTAQPDVTEERKGPSIDAPDKAIKGFLKANGFSSVDDAEIRELPKGKFYFAVVERKGRPTNDVLKEIVEKALADLPWPKSMRWASGQARWVRPLHRILCLFDGAVVPVSFEGITAANKTVGHRFLAPDEIMVKNFADYESKLEAAKIIADPARRRDMIANGLQTAAQKEGLTVPDDPALLDEVTGLVEWLVPLIGTIDDAFMDVPPEVLTSAMRKHQKYFALADKDGAFANRFALVANMETGDGGAAIVDGNERVLRARLSDAKFFWDQDRKEKLYHRVDKLNERVFQADLGTVHDKIQRVETLAAAIAERINGASQQSVRRAAMLCKADLSTGMVGEFPDLQGIMGRYYAQADHEPDDVCDAIADHYSPLGPSDTCPSAPVSVCIALADKIDTLVGFFGIDQKPTGSKDPYALRRAALGVIRLVLENSLRLSLKGLFTVAYQAYGASLKVSVADVSDSLMAFFADRLKVHLKEQGVAHDLISAVFAVKGEDDLVRLMARVKALEEFLNTDDGTNLLTAYKRAANIVRIEEKKDKCDYQGKPNKKRINAAEGETLLSALEKAETSSTAANAKEDFVASMKALSQLRKPVDTFFDTVTVNTDNKDERVARLNLLSEIVRTVNQVAVFSNIEG